MTRAALISRVNSELIDPEIKAHVIGAILRCWPDRPIIGLGELLNACCMAVGTNVQSVRTKIRTRENVTARMLFIFYLTRHAHGRYSLKLLGDFLGGRDHTTIIHSRESALDLEQAKDPIFLHEIDNLYKILAGEPYTVIRLIKRDRQPRHQRIHVKNIQSGKVYHSMISAARDINATRRYFDYWINKTPGTSNFPFIKLKTS